MPELWQEVETGNEHDFSCACQLLSLNKTFRVFSGQRKTCFVQISSSKVDEVI